MYALVRSMTLKLNYTEENKIIVTYDKFKLTKASGTG